MAVVVVEVRGGIIRKGEAKKNNKTTKEAFPMVRILRVCECMGPNGDAVDVDARYIS